MRLVSAGEKMTIRGEVGLGAIGEDLEVTKQIAQGFIQRPTSEYLREKPCQRRSSVTRRALVWRVETTNTLSTKPWRHYG